MLRVEVGAVWSFVGERFLAGGDVRWRLNAAKIWGTLREVSYVVEREVYARNDWKPSLEKIRQHDFCSIPARDRLSAVTVVQDWVPLLRLHRSSIRLHVLIRRTSRRSR